MIQSIDEESEAKIVKITEILKEQNLKDSSVDFVCFYTSVLSAK